MYQAEALVLSVAGGGFVQSMVSRAAQPDFSPALGDVATVHRPDFYVADPLSQSQVWEVVGSELGPSKQHGAGISIRFPRVQRDRSDEKDSLQATSLAELKLLVEDSRGAGTTLAGAGTASVLVAVTSSA